MRETIIQSEIVIVFDQNAIDTSLLLIDLNLHVNQYEE